MEAYEIALESLHNGTSVAEDILNLFRAAPLIAAENRGIESAIRKVNMHSATVSDIESDFVVDPDAKNNYLFHFFLAYLRSHVHGGYLDEMEADRIMDYLNDRYDLFGCS